MRHSERPQKLTATAFDGLAAALSPALIIGMIGSLVYFLVIAFYRGDYDARLMYVLGLYTAAIVLVARIAIESDRMRAMLFAAPLAVAAVLAMMRFVTISGELAPLSWIVNVGLLALTWYLADRITFDCTLLEEDRESLQGGLLQTIGASVAQASGQESRPLHPVNKAGQQPIGAAPLKKAKHNPGVWVLYFALVAFPLFGVGQLVIPDQRQRSIAFWCLVVYLACALALLMTTSLLGMRRYLRQRGAMMPPEITAKWLVAGGVITLVVLLACMLMPLPGKQLSVAGLKIELTSPDNLPTSKFGWGNEGPQNSTDGTAEPASEPRPGNTASPEPSDNRPDSADSNQPNPNGNQNGRKPGGKGGQGQGQSADQSAGQSAGQTAASSAKDGQGGNKPGQGSQPGEANDGKPGQASGGNQAESSGEPQPSGSQGENAPKDAASGTGKRPGSKQNSRAPADNQPPNPQTNSDPTNSRATKPQGNQAKSKPGQAEQTNPGQPNSNSPNSVKPDRNSPNDPKADSPAEPARAGQPPEAQPQAQSEPQPQPQPEPLRAGNSLSQTSRSLASSLLDTLKTLGSLFKWLLIAILAGIVLLYVATHFEEFKRLVQDLMNFINGLLGRKVQSQVVAEQPSAAAVSQPVRRPFRSFDNPFAGGAKGWPGPQVVMHTFAALEAWAAQRGRTRAADQTAEEFARTLVAQEPELDRYPLQAASMLDRVMFAGWQPSKQEVASLAQLWERMQD